MSKLLLRCTGSVPWTEFKCSIVPEYFSSSYLKKKPFWQALLSSPSLAALLQGIFALYLFKTKRSAVQLYVVKKRFFLLKIINVSSRHFWQRLPCLVPLWSLKVGCNFSDRVLTKRPQNAYVTIVFFWWLLLKEVLNQYNNLFWNNIGVLEASLKYRFTHVSNGRSTWE